MWRRKEPLHERLAREGGLRLPDPAPHDPGPRWGEAGIHGLHRPREWDAVLVADAPTLEGDEFDFVALADGTLVVQDDLPEGALDPLAEAVERSVRRPYRAEAVRRGGSRFAVAASAIEVVELPEEIEAERIELTVYSGERELRLDGERAFGRIPALEAVGESRFAHYVLRADRLDETVWEVRVEPL